MEKINIINNFSKMFTISFFTYYMFVLLIGYKKNSFLKLFIILLFSIIIAYFYSLLTKNPNRILIIPVIYCFYALFIKLITKQKINNCLFLSSLSMITAYIIYIISILLSGIMFLVFFPKINYNNPISIFAIFAIMAFLYYLISEIKRLKNGINFLKNNENVEKISIIVNVISIVLFTGYASPDNLQNANLYAFLALVVIFLAILIMFWTRSQITKYYKKNMRDRTIEVQKAEIDEQKRIMEEVKEENLKLADVVHKYNNRLSAVEIALEEAINKNMNTEFSSELSVILDETKELSKNFAKESEILKTKLPLTNIVGIDNMFNYMQKEAMDNNINFDLKLNDSIHDLIDNIIPKDKFETLLGDHLRDAIIAINFSDNTYKSILVTLGLVENNYELSIYDTGIEFEIETLLKLGKERITTHKDTGGSGIGFMTTFETLKETKASLIIEEYNPETTSYTKSINIRFDGKFEYRIYSYRAEEIKKKNKDKKIIIKII